MSALPRFREFTIWLKSNERASVSSSTAKKLFRARARHNFAKQFRGLRVHGASESLARGYSAGMQLFLCYSAAEAMGSAIGNHVGSWELCDESLETSLRRIAALLPERRDVLSNGVRRSVEAFIRCDHRNLRVVATALRHLVAHGEFTPTGNGLLTKSAASTIRSLGICLLVESERQFSAWFDELLAV